MSIKKTLVISALSARMKKWTEPTCVNDSDFSDTYLQRTGVQRIMAMAGVSSGTDIHVINRGNLTIPDLIKLVSQTAINAKRDGVIFDPVVIMSNNGALSHQIEAALA